MKQVNLVQPEAAIWCTLCWVILIARLFSRRLRLGAWTRLQLEDYVAVLAMILATTLMKVMDDVEDHFSKTIVRPFSLDNPPADLVQERVHGSKLLVCAEQLQIFTVWSTKAALLLMYNRMTALLAQHKQVVLASMFVGSAFIFMEMFYFAVWCRPFSDYWSVKPSSSQCGIAINHLVTSLVLNVSSDILIISIPLPLLFRLHLPTIKKVILTGPFLIGFFTIISAIASKVYSFLFPNSLGYTIWYLREAFTAILCANLPLLYPLFQEVYKHKTWGRHSFLGPLHGNSPFRSASHGFHLGDPASGIRAPPPTFWSTGQHRSVSSYNSASFDRPSSMGLKSARSSISTMMPAGTSSHSDPSTKARV